MFFLMGDLQKVLKPRTFDGKDTVLAFWASFQLVFSCIDGCLLAPKQTKKYSFLWVSTKKWHQRCFVGFYQVWHKGSKISPTKLLCDSNSPTELILELPVLLQQHAHKCPHFFIKRLPTPATRGVKFKFFFASPLYCCFFCVSLSEAVPLPNFVRKGHTSNKRLSNDKCYPTLLLPTHSLRLAQLSVLPGCLEIFRSKAAKCWQFFFPWQPQKKERKERKERKMQPISLLPRERCSPWSNLFLPKQKQQKSCVFLSAKKKQHGLFRGKPSPKRAAAEAPSSVVCSIFNCKAKAKSKNEANLRWSCRKKTCSVRFIFFLTAEKKQFCLWTFSFQKLFAPCKTAKYGKRPWQSCAWRYLSSKNRKKDPFCVRRSSVEMERTWRLLQPLSKSLADGFVTVSFLLLLASEFVTLRWMNTNDGWQGFLWGV